MQGRSVPASVKQGLYFFPEDRQSDGLDDIVITAGFKSLQHGGLHSITGKKQNRDIADNPGGSGNIQSAAIGNSHIQKQEIPSLFTLCQSLSAGTADLTLRGIQRILITDASSLLSSTMQILIILISLTHHKIQW